MKSPPPLLLLAIYILSFLNGRSQAQLIEYPTVPYKKMTFDYVHRGSFNMTQCAKELINCWEIIKPDIICSFGDEYHESVCGALRNHCSEKRGPLDVNYKNKPFPLFTMVCDSKQVYTRRFITIPRNDTAAAAPERLHIQNSTSHRR